MLDKRHQHEEWWTQIRAEYGQSQLMEQVYCDWLLWATYGYPSSEVAALRVELFPDLVNLRAFGTTCAKNAQSVQIAQLATRTA